MWQIQMMYIVLFSIMLIQAILNIIKVRHYYEYVKACREFLKACSCADKERPQDYKEYTDAFVKHIQKLEQGGKNER
jgi:hypothetical protein